MLRPATKQLSLWRAADIVIVHLMRFNTSGNRVNMMVDVPLDALDFTQYFSPESPFRVVENNRFTLYAVCNHIGR